MWFLKSVIKDEKNFERKKRQTLVSQCVCGGAVGVEGWCRQKHRNHFNRKERFFSEKIIEWWKRLPQKAESKTTEGVGLPGGSVIKNAGDTGSIPDPGRPHMPRSN